MSKILLRIITRSIRLGLPILLALGTLIYILHSLHQPAWVRADPIPPPEGWPKLTLSTKSVTPTLATTAGETLWYRVEIVNTGAYTAQATSLVDVLPENVTYNDDAQSNVGIDPVFVVDTLTWSGDVGFDSTVIISFSVDIDSGFAGTIENTALISQALLSNVVTITAETVVTDHPILAIGKSATPLIPGAGKPLTYTLVVTNYGQPAIALPITVTDQLPADTSLRAVGADGSAGPGSLSAIWQRTVSLGTGANTIFEFSVDIDDVVSGTVITNDTYQVESAVTGVTAGTPYTSTVLDPVLTLSKQLWPDPPGSNREMTYTLILLNQGSLATNIVVSDIVPMGMSYVRGGSFNNGVVSWNLPRLDTDEISYFTFTTYISDVAAISVVNSTYMACSGESICAVGMPLTSTIQGPSFLATAALDPIAKKPGGGGGPVTPTLTIENLGPGNALDASAVLVFERISVQLSDIEMIPARGSLVELAGCGDQCSSYLWTGDIGYQETITFTTSEGQNTIGGAEGTLYTTTIMITDSLGIYTTEPVSATASGRVTHLANLIPDISAPSLVGAGQLMTYTIGVWNSALATDDPPFPWLTDTVPLSVTVVSVSDGGISYDLDGTTIVSWTLPAMSPGDLLQRSFIVQVDETLISGTQIVNNDYWAAWYEQEDNAILTNTGSPVTTTIRETGLIDSFKIVTPTLLHPVENNVLTYSLHLVNSGPALLENVSVYDLLPWQYSTYQRQAVATAGQIISDIVSIHWTGEVKPFSQEVITLTVLVDPFYEGPITNTAIISHSSLLAPLPIQAVAYITDDPVLRITKSAAPDPVPEGSELIYTILVENLGQLATQLVITDRIPIGTLYVEGSVTGNGQLQDDVIQWQTTALEAGQNQSYSFSVHVGRQDFVINEDYAVTSEQGVSARGAPVVTAVDLDGTIIYLPVILKP